MKPQDLLFIIFFIGIILFKRKSNWFVWTGLLCLTASIPLFAKWIFFTAERLVWYAAALFLFAAIFKFIELKRGRTK